MADLTFEDLNNVLEHAPFKYNSTQNYYYIHLNALLDYPTSFDLMQDKVGQMIAALLEACVAAQVNYNADEVNTKDLRSYLRPTTSAPTQNADGSYASTFTYTVSLRRPLVATDVSAIEV